MQCSGCGHSRHNHGTSGWPRYREVCQLCTHCLKVKPLGKDCCTSPDLCRCVQFTLPEPTNRWVTDTEAGAIG